MILRRWARLFLIGFADAEGAGFADADGEGFAEAQGEGFTNADGEGIAKAKRDKVLPKPNATRGFETNLCFASRR